MGELPPGSLGMPYVGEALQFLKDPFTFTQSRTQKHGNVWKTRIMGDTTVFFVGPKLFSLFMNPENFTRENGSPSFVQEVFHPDAVPFLDGEKHRRRKHFLNAAFSHDAINGYLPGIWTVIERFVPGWTTGGERAIADELSQLAFDIADVLFAAADPSRSNVERARDFEIMIKGSFSPPIKLPFTAYGKGLKARDRMREYIKASVASRDGKGTALGILKGARGEAGEQLSTAELEIELVHFFSAAHAGLMAAFAWCMVVLGEKPEVAAKIREEADAVLGDGAPTFAQIKQLTYARAVMREVLRTYPIAPVTFTGIAKRDLDVEGYTIPSGCKAVGAIWPTLHDAATFQDPMTFKVDRLGDDAVKALPANAFVPQGGGPPEGHRCPGEPLVQLVLPAFMAWLMKHYDLKLPAQDVTHGPGVLGPMPKSGLRIQLGKRA